ncbi:MAG: hypothetical protein ACREF7_02990 [Candidatus Saccharimonadales bacterium]
MMHLLAITSTHKKPLTAVLLLADVLFFAFSDPSRMPLPVLIIGWLLVALSTYLLFSYGSRLFRKYGLIKQERRISIIALSGFIYLLLVLQAVGQLSLRDIAALVPLAIIGYLYFRRAKTQVPA